MGGPQTLTERPRLTHRVLNFTPSDVIGSARLYDFLIRIYTLLRKLCAMQVSK